MKLEIQSEGTDLKHVHFEEDLDYHHSTEMRDRLNDMMEENPKKVLIDLSGVPYMDSSAIAAFVELSQKSRAANGRIAFYGLQDSVRNIFELAKLNLFFTLAGDQEEARKALEG